MLIGRHVWRIKPAKLDASETYRRQPLGRGGPTRLRVSGWNLLSRVVMSEASMRFFLLRG